MIKNKTIQTTADVSEFINAFTHTEQKKNDSYALLKLMEEVSGHKPKMWGPSIIGFGSYHYKYASGHEGDAPLLGFSPRKTAISLYVYTAEEEHKYLLDELGKFKIGKACIYINKLTDISEDKLKKMMQITIGYLQDRYRISK